jgi:nucleoside-diphosphate-sugar epimerase
MATAKTVLEMTGSTSAVEYRPMPIDDPTQRQPDISAARSVLGWEPTVPLRDGLPRVIEYFRTELG